MATQGPETSVTPTGSHEVEKKTPAMLLRNKTGPPGRYPTGKRGIGKFGRKFGRCREPGFTRFVPGLLSFNTKGPTSFGT